MNSSAALKAFVGRNGGAVCTSTNARAILDWALGKGDRAGKESVGATGSGDKVLFFPDQHLGRNTGLADGLRPRRHAGVEPAPRARRPHRGRLKDATLLLWRGWCSVHQRFTPEHVEAFRAEHPGGIVVTHPECRYDTCQLADHVGSTDFIIRTVNEAPTGSVIGVGTEIHLVNRLNDETPDKTVVSLDPLVCPCSTMFRIDAAHLCWVLENLVEGNVVNQITVDPDTTEWAKVALQRMLEIV